MEQQGSRFSGDLVENRRVKRALQLFFLVALISLTAIAAIGSEPLENGVVREVEVGVEPSHRYLVALPSDYDPAREWPVLYLLDARGRAEIPMELFREPALERGFVVVSSMNTMSDGDPQVNLVAIRYLWHDTHKRFSLDDDRVVMAGFSGLARFLWNIPELRIPLTGAIGVGAGLPAPRIAESARNLPFYGVVGDRDFNWREMVILQDRLDELGHPNRLEIFSGPHGWFTESATAARALDWISLRWWSEEADLRKLLEAEVKRRDALVSEGRLLEAGALERKLVRDYAGISEGIERKVPETQLELLALERRKEILDETEWVKLSERAVAIAVAPDAGERERARAIEMIGAAELVDDLERDDARGAAAGRRLGQLRAQLDFYVPRLLLDRGEPERALQALEMSAAIGDPGPRNRLQRARALTRLGRHDEALDLLEHLVVDDGLSTEYLESESFAALRELERYRDLVESP